MVKHGEISHQRWAQIHNPTSSLVYDAQVIEDTGTGVNFIHPTLVSACDLQIYQTAPTVHKVITGHQFKSDKWVQVEWLGRPGRTGTDLFYVAPEEAPIGLLVGRTFLKENQDVFMSKRPEPDSMLLNVESKRTVSLIPQRTEIPRWLPDDWWYKQEAEQIQIQANRAAAAAQSAALEKKRRDKQQQKSKNGKRPRSPSSENSGVSSKKHWFWDDRRP
jgi:hypothetical protein